MPQAHRPFQRLVDRPPWRIDALVGASDRLVIAFSSVGHDPTRPPSPEFVASATATGATALFVSDESRSWANDPGLDGALRDAIASLGMHPARILALGQSMGGFAVLAAASMLPVSAVLAFGPQFTVHPDHAPPETRWQNWTTRITTHRHLTAPLPDGPHITLMHGLMDDTAQAAAFPARPGLDHVLYPAQTHSSLVAHLKARGVLAGLIDAALAGDRRRLMRICASAGGRLRQRLQDQLPR